MDREGRVCCDPFKKSHTNFTKLFPVTKSLIKSAKEQGFMIKLGEDICFLCRKRIWIEKSRSKSREIPRLKDSAIDRPIASSRQCEGMHIDLNETIGPITGSESTEDIESDENIELSNIDVESVKKIVNDLLKSLNLSAIDEARLRGKKYQMETVKNLTTRFDWRFVS